MNGYDFVDHDRHPNDRYGHGTHVAGTIAQATNNGMAVAGVAYGAKIMPLRVLNDSARATPSRSPRRSATRPGAAPT